MGMVDRGSAPAIIHPKIAEHLRYPQQHHRPLVTVAMNQMIAGAAKVDLEGRLRMSDWVVRMA